MAYYTVAYKMMMYPRLPDSICTYVQDMHFHPCNYNARLVSMSEKKAQIRGENGEWQVVHVDDAIHELINRTTQYLDKMNAKYGGIRPLTEQEYRITRSRIVDLLCNLDQKIELANIHIDF